MMISAGRRRSSSASRAAAVLQFGGEKIARGQIHQREAEDFSHRIDHRQEIIAFGHQQALVEMRARAKGSGSPRD
jgi:hypothetical protein